MLKHIYLFIFVCLVWSCEKSPIKEMDGTEETGKNQFTPVVVAVNHEPTVFPGSDGKQHLVYEIILNNTTSLPFVLRKIEINNPETGQNLRTVSQSHIHSLTSRIIVYWHQPE